MIRSAFFMLVLFKWIGLHQVFKFLWLALFFSCLWVVELSAQNRPKADSTYLDFSELPSYDFCDGMESSEKGLHLVQGWGKGKIVFPEMEIPIKRVKPFLSFSLVWYLLELNQQDPQFHIRHKQNGETWSDWEVITWETHGNRNSLRRVGSPLSLDKDTDLIQLSIEMEANSGTILRGLSLHFYSPGISTGSTPTYNDGDTESSCPCPQPASLSRNEWCPGNDCPSNPSPVYTTATHLIVHHSGTSNNSNDWAAVVRSIWNYHVNVQGWADIGYNWLIDPNGVVYEGRGDGIRGAHFCSTNSKTMGMCVLGHFNDQQPSNPAYNKLVDWLGWECCDKNLDPYAVAFHTSSGLNLFRISGHKDGCSTDCPGNSFYPTFGSLRNDVDDYINGCGTAGNVPDIYALNLWTEPGNPQTGQEVDLFVEITNGGDGLANDIFLTYQVDNVFVDNDTHSSLNPGETSIKQVTNYVFSDPGNYDYCVVIDSVAGETNVGNNISCITIEVGGGGSPDIAIESMDTNPQEVIVGEPTDVEVYLVNNGNDVAEDIYLRYFLNGQYLDDDSHSSLDPGETKKEEKSNYVFTQTGTYEICVEIDPVNGEIDTTNNQECIVLEVDNVSSTIHASFPDGVQLFPNPNNGIVQINHPLHELESVRIFRLDGQIVFQNSSLFRNHTLLNLSNLSKGAYLVQIQIDSEIYIEKLIIQ